MGKLCVICNCVGKYKCPTCLVYYCSVDCCKKHRENNCSVAKLDDPVQDEKPEDHNVHPTPSTVDKNKLEYLKDDKELKQMLKDNPHLRNLLVTVDKAQNAEEIMQKAMQEPIFVEFADACLKIVEPHADDAESP